MNETLRLLAIFAHPDDETLAAGGTLAKYAAEGVETHLITATRGHFGWFGAPDKNPGPQALGEIREAELKQAAPILGLRNVTLLDYIDGELDQADPEAIVDQLAHEIRVIRPHVVITFGPDGLYGHPDHIAISQFATAAVLSAVEPEQAGPVAIPGHRVAKLYYRIASPDWMSAYEDAVGELVMEIDGRTRRNDGFPAWMINASVDASAYWRRVWAAARQHRSQLPGYDRLARLPDADHRFIWGTQEYYRAMSLVNGGRVLERDLFEGIATERATAAPVLDKAA